MQNKIICLNKKSKATAITVERAKANMQRALPERQVYVAQENLFAANIRSHVAVETANMLGTSPGKQGAVARANLNAVSDSLQAAVAVANMKAALPANQVRVAESNMHTGNPYNRDVIVGLNVKAALPNNQLAVAKAIINTVLAYDLVHTVYGVMTSVDAINQVAVARTAMQATPANEFTLPLEDNAPLVKMQVTVAEVLMRWAAAQNYVGVALEIMLGASYNNREGVAAKIVERLQDDEPKVKALAELLVAFYLNEAEDHLALLINSIVKIKQNFAKTIYEECEKMLSAEGKNPLPLRRALLGE